MMRSFLALYRGPSIEQSELIAVSADHKLIRNFVEGMVEEDEEDLDPRRDHRNNNGHGSTRDYWEEGMGHC